MKKLGRHYSEWIENKTCIEMFQDDPIEVYQSYLRGECKVRRLASRTDHLLTWHFNRYINAVLNEDRYPLDDFALCARYAKAAVQFESAFADAGKKGSVLIDQAVFNFSLNILSGWRTDANTIGHLLVKGLDTSLLDLKHNDRHEKG